MVVNRLASSYRTAAMRGTRLALIVGWLLLGVTPSSAQSTVYIYDNATTGAIPNVGTDAACNTGGLARTFVVGDSFTVASIALGLNVTHAERGDLRVRLVAPGGTGLNFVVQSTDTDDNYDVMLSTNNDGAGVHAIDDASSDPVADPYFYRLVNLSTANFYTGTSAGTWTLRVCDRDTGNGVTGTFNRARLVLGRTAVTGAQVCTSTVSTDFAANGNNTAFTSQTSGGITLTLTSTADATGDGANTNGRNNFTTQTGTFGNQTGYYLQQMDLEQTTDWETALLRTNWSFSVPVRDLRWTLLDCDNGTDPLGGNEDDWEDYLRTLGFNAVGAYVPFTMTNVDVSDGDDVGTSRAGDTAESDGAANVVDTATTGNIRLDFIGDVSTLRVDYTTGQDVIITENPASQRIGNGNATWCGFDYGDAPNTYGTQLAGGARHVLGNRTLYLGTNPPDGESNGAPGAAATTDDTTQISGVDDEDGVASFPSTGVTQGSYTVSVTAVNRSTTTAGNLVGYIDWNRDGDFADANEISATTNVPANTNSATPFNVVWNSAPIGLGGTTATYARFRIAYVAAEAQSPTGQAASGEVEDYPIGSGTLPVTIAHVESAAEGERLTVRFTTASSWANGAFVVHGRGAGAQEWSELAEVSAHAPDSLAPERYEVAVNALGVEELLIEDVSLFGERRTHGPFAVGEAYGEEPQAAAIDWAAVRAELAAAPAARAAAAGLRVSAAAATATEGLLLVREEGIHRVTHEQLLAAGIDLTGTPAARIVVFDKGKAVARWVSTPAGTFGPGSFVEFVGRPALTLASPSDAYVLSVQRTDAAGPATLPAGAGAVAVVAAEDRYAPDRVYGFSSPNGDPWYDQGLLARGGAAALTRTFGLPDLAAGPVALTVRSWGYGDWAGTSPDHHVVVSLNGTVIADDRFDGITPLERTVDVTSLVTPTGNTLEFRVPGDTGYMFDYMAFEGFSVSYQRSSVARGGRFAGTVGSGTGFAVAGFGGAEPVALWRLKGKVWQRGEQAPAGGQVVVSGNGSLWAAERSKLLVPGIVAGVPAPLESSSAQYVIVTHPALAGALGDLVALQQGRGFSTEVITTDRIYAAYSDHATSAEAIKQFLTASYRKRTLRYVLLAGADTADPYDHLGRGSMTLVPTAYLPFVQYVTFSPTDETLVDVNGDNVGEVPIGRLPARTPAELQEMVAKIVAWEQNVAPSGRSTLLTAGGGGIFTAINQSFANSLDTWATTLASVEGQGTAGVRSAVLAALNAGTPMVSYVGHSSMGQWDFTPILTWQDVATLTNAGRPNLLVQWGCWNAYYVEPNVESLSARLMRTPGVGAAATIGATTLTTEISHLALGTLFFAKLNGTPTSLGDAFHAAKVELLTSGAPKDALLGMAFLGDPAMSVPR